MYSLCSELTPRALIPDTRIPQFMQPWSNILFIPEGKLFTLKNSGIGTCATKYQKGQFVTIGGWDKGAHGKVDRWGTNYSFLFPHSYDFKNKKLDA